MYAPSSKLLWSTAALILAGIIGGLAPLASKIALRELPPLTILFLRVTLMVIVLVPLVAKSIRPLLTQKWKLLGVGLLWAGNVTFFILGIQFTTTIASQLLYTGVPVLVLIGNFFLKTERLTVARVIGIGLGLIGAIGLLIDPESLQPGLGQLSGNVIIFLATISWGGYLLFSKRLSAALSPLVLTTSSAVIGWFVSGSLLLAIEGMAPLRSIPDLSWQVWLALLFLGLISGIGMYFFYQYGIKHGSALAAASMNYISVLTAAITGILFLSESITTRLWLFGSLLIIGVLFISIWPLLKIRQK